MKYKFFFVLLSLWHLSVFSQSFSDFSNFFYHKEFINKNLDIDHIEFFFQDSIERVWAGSFTNGLMVFNGESFVTKTPSIGTYGIRCKLALTDTEYLIGTRDGLYSFNLKSLELNPVPPFLNGDIIGLSRISSSEILVFCSNKIAKIQLNDSKTDILLTCNNYRFVKYEILPEGTYILLTDKEGVLLYHYPTQTLTPVILNDKAIKNELLLCVLLDNDILWIGSDQGLLKYSLITHQTVRISDMDGISNKTFMKDKYGSIWVGTNNGLYIFHQDSQKPDHYLHNTGDEKSLLNDCVWSIFEDTEGNIWLGVDGGISFIPKKQFLFQIKWNDIFRSDNGNRILHVLLDRYGNYWFGGTNGIGCYMASTGESTFFEMQGANKIHNNMIRTIYEDTEGIIWIGTDNGLAWFDRKNKKFIFCNVEDPMSKRNAVWTYGIIEGTDGDMWIATCSGGLFVVEKSILMSQGKTYKPAKYNYHSDSETHKMTHNACLGVISDSSGNFWVNGKYLYIDKRDMDADDYPKELTIIPCEGVISLICDKDGYIWGAYKTGFYKISPHDNHIENIEINDYVKEYGIINSMTEYGDYIWFLTSNSMGIIHKKTNVVSHIIAFTSAQYKTCYYDARNQLIWIGGMDNCLVLRPQEYFNHNVDIYPSFTIMEIYVNGEIIDPLKNNNGRFILEEDIAYCNRLNLNYEENRLSFKISTGRLSREIELRSGFYYRMKGLENTWKAFNMINPFIEYSYLNYGKYSFEIGKQDTETQQIKIVKTLDIFIKPPWNYTVWFKLLVALVIVVLFFTSINYYKAKTKLHIAEIEKEKSEELIQTKLRFFTNIGHEFRTPLTLIMTPLSTLIHHSTSESLKQKLIPIYRNTEDMLGLINQLLDFRKLEMGGEKLKLSCEDFVKFAEYVYLTFKDVARNKSIQFTFESDVKHLYMGFDKSKIRKVINNIYSNALKFTSEEGYIDTTIRLVQEGDREFVRLDIADTGCGIPDKEQQTIFERFYQSENNDSDVIGSGIGLHLTKEYVGLHGGHIKVNSKLGDGSVFSVFIPTYLQTSGSDIQVVSDSDVDAKFVSNDKQVQKTLLIVEDNMELRHFLAEQFEGKFSVLQAIDGKQGIDIAMKKFPDLIISDLMMPVMNGLNMCQRLKTDIQTSHIPIILLTAQLSDETKIDSYKVGADSFIAKPFSFEVLLTRVETLIEQQEKRKNNFHKAIEITPSSITTTSLDEELIKKTLLAVEKNMDNSEYSVDDLSEEIAISRRHLSRKLQAIIGLSPSEFIRSVRLKRAAQLLKESQYNISEIAYMVGFSTFKYFNLNFKEKFGLTPTQYRKENTGSHQSRGVNKI